MLGRPSAFPPIADYAFLSDSEAMALVAPSGHDAAHVLVRTVSCVHGFVELHVECEPAFDYGRRPAEWQFVGPGYGYAVASAPGSELQLRLATDLRLGLEGGRARARMTLR